MELPPTFVKEASVYLKPSDNKLTIKLANKTLCCTIGVYFLPDLVIRPSRILVVTWDTRRTGGTDHLSEEGARIVVVAGVGPSGSGSGIRTNNLVKSQIDTVSYKHL